jgi:hypothetical protein
MRTAMLKRMVKRLADRAAASPCPECADWPSEVGLRIVAVVIEPGEVLPPPDSAERNAAEYGPCPCCGRTHRARVVAIEE